ncbi:MAG TPA: L,D-transpeptidase family protein [Chitinophagaceae bacterium]|nr:L,D-transpeptidase family protein [Chitinophagaceae bacterium]
MFKRTKAYLIFALFISMIFIFSCKSKHAATEKQIVATPEEMDTKVTENVKAVLQYALDNNGKINDSIKLRVAAIVDSFYHKNDYVNIWSRNEKWEPIADSLYNFIEGAETYGLFPSDYHYKDIREIRSALIKDTLAKTDANTWTIAELMLSDAFMQLSKHLKQGRLLPDSISLSANSAVTNDFFIKNLNTVIRERSLTSLLNTLEPKHTGYSELKKGIKRFTDSMDRRRYTYVIYPNKDSLAFIKNLQKRLQEGEYLDVSVKQADSEHIASAVKNFQKRRRIKADGKITASLVRSLNSTDVERFKRIAINIDRYKQLPDKLPERYIWVNLPGYYLRVIDNDTVVFESKTIVGKPATRTPALNSVITDMVTYPQWTIPNSIIKKDILPALKRDPGYLARKGFSLVDSKGEAIDPYSIDWTKYSKGIPYKIVQGSGDDNALGILKFNFNNPYSVYLHDTNQRYLFKNSSRALSHGCVRVQDWEKLAFYIAENDSIYQTVNNPPAYNIDSIKTWLANKERKRIIVKNRLPLYIRYFTCEGKKGKIIFYDDIYSEDKTLREKYFAGK